MSGFEVAGLVLGAIPIIVESLKLYNETRSLIAAYRNKRTLIAAFIEDLRLYHFIVNEQVGKVLHGAGVHVSEQDLWSGNAAKALGDARLNEIVSEHLGEQKFDLFCAQLRICQEAVAGIICLFEGLVVQTDGTTPETDDKTLQRLIAANVQSGGSVWKERGRKLKFSFKGKDIATKVKKLKDATDRIKEPGLQTPHDFTFAETVSSDISNRALKKLVQSFEVVQQQAHRLYYALISTLPRSCHQSHSIRLFLDDRVGPLRHASQAARRGGKQQFRVELLGYSGDGNVDTWHKCDITARSETQDDDASLTRNGQFVRFMVTSTDPMVEQVGIFCICLRTVTERQKALKLQLCMRRGLCYSESNDCLSLQESMPRLQESISLDEVIRKAASPARLPERNWSPKYRVILALRLACSVMQLNRTHWLGKRCTSSSLYFKRTMPDTGSFIPGAPPPFEADQPFILRSDPPGFLDEEPEHWAHVLVLDLAIVLMEICSLETFKQMCARQGCEIPTTHADRREKADRWLVELENEADQKMTPHYRRAIQRCIEITGRTSYSFQNETFREDLCEGVVKSLWANCKEWLQ